MMPRVVVEINSQEEEKSFEFNYSEDEFIHALEDGFVEDDGSDDDVMDRREGNALNGGRQLLIWEEDAVSRLSSLLPPEVEMDAVVKAVKEYCIQHPFVEDADTIVSACCGPLMDYLTRVHLTSVGQASSSSSSLADHREVEFVNVHNDLGTSSAGTKVNTGSEISKIAVNDIRTDCVIVDLEEQSQELPIASRKSLKRSLADSIKFGSLDNAHNDENEVTFVFVTPSTTNGPARQNSFHSPDTIDFDPPLNDEREAFNPVKLMKLVSPVDCVCDVFPDADVDYVRKLLSSNGGDAQVVIQLMADKGYDKRRQQATPKAVQLDFTSLSWETDKIYQTEAAELIQLDFPFLRVPRLRELFSVDCKNHFYAAVTLLEKHLNVRAGSVVRSLTASQLDAMANGLEILKLTTKAVVERNLVQKRQTLVSKLKSITLGQEVSWMQQQRKKQDEEADRIIAEKLNLDIAEQEGALIECGCCCGEYPFESCVQCSEGHLFCRQCLQRYAEQTVFGDGKSQLKCMNSFGDGCTGYFPDSMLRASLSDKVFSKLQEAQARDAIKAAHLELITCFQCGFQVELPEAAGILMHCPSCTKSTCRLCGEEGHVPLKCSEVEKKAHSDARTSVEEAMTQARIRECQKCKAKFFKTEGCNKMTCSCGAKICYICRKDISKQGYAHFCQTAHCDHKSCGKCVLFTNSIEDDRRAMYEAGVNALKAKESDMANPVAESGKQASAPIGIQIEKLLEGGKLRDQPLGNATAANPARVAAPPAAMRVGDIRADLLAALGGFVGAIGLPAAYRNILAPAPVLPPPAAQQNPQFQPGRRRRGKRDRRNG